MKVLIAGSRGITDYALLEDTITHSNLIEITEVISGTAKGVDQLGERYAKEHNIPLKCFPADWRKYGKGAGMKRNKEMVDYCEGAIILWDGKSRGTQNTINLMEKANKPFMLRILK